MAIEIKLTRRQEEFIRNLHDLSHNAEGPIHYTVLADRLGVSPFTAYDMLCLLEEKGLVISQYQLDSQKSGPGRAERLFYPSPQALLMRRQFLNVIGVEDFETGNGGKVVLEKMCSHHSENIELAEEMLARIPPDAPPGKLRYCLEVLTVIALRLRQIDMPADFISRLGDILPGGKTIRRSDLCLLVGYVYGILSRSWSTDPGWVGELQSHVGECLEIIIHSHPQELSILGNYASKLFIQPAAADLALEMRETIEQH